MFALYGNDSLDTTQTQFPFASKVKIHFLLNITNILDHRSRLKMSDFFVFVTFLPSRCNVIGENLFEEDFHFTLRVNFNLVFIKIEKLVLTIAST